MLNRAGVTDRYRTGLPRALPYDPSRLDSSLGVTKDNEPGRFAHSFDLLNQLIYFSFAV